jgi:hypothetical protein
MRSRFALLLALWLPLQLLLWSIGGHGHLPGLHAGPSGCPHGIHAEALDPADPPADPDASEAGHRHCPCQLLGIPALTLRVVSAPMPAARPLTTAPPCLECAPSRPERPQWTDLA